MRNRRRWNLLLDTSFLLPTLGVDVGEEVTKALEALSEMGMEAYYSRFSLLECLWVGAKLQKRGQLDKELFNLGIRSIAEGEKYRPVEEDSRVFTDALNLHELGHGDMIDNLLYASSVRFNLKFLTIDEDLRKFVSEKKLSDTLLLPEDISHFY